MLDPASISSLLHEQIIARAERLLAKALAAGSLSDDALRLLEAVAADMHERRRIDLEETMLLPFRSARVRG